MTDIAIYDLADFPQWIPIISGWFCRDGHPSLIDGPGDAEPCVEEWLRLKHLRSVLVAVVDGELVGTVALQDKMQPFADSPWISGLYVVPGFRKRGIGTRLLRAAENKARAIGLSKIYLYTPRSTNFYGAFGWNLHHDTARFSGKAAVMEKLLTPHSLFQPQPPALRG